MEQEENQLSEQESLSIIQQMIDTAKQEQKDDGKGWIVWGWMLFSASILSYINLKTGWFSTFFFWDIFGALTIVLFIIEAVRNFVFKKKTKVKTYTQAIFEKLNIGFFISLMFIIVAMNTGDVHPTKGFALLMCLYGFWILIYGSLLNFKPSIIGAFITFVIAYFSIFLDNRNFDIVMLLQAVAVLCGYIIPGHIANRQFKKLHSRSINEDSV